MKINKDKRGVFGLTSVQMFFSIILGLALLAYVIVTIMGTLSQASIVPTSTVQHDLVANETVSAVTDAGYTQLANYNAATHVICTVETCLNSSSNSVIIGSVNKTISNCGIKFSGIDNTLGLNGSDWKCSYTWKDDSPSARGAVSIVNNVSTGLTSFFGAINPVYAILAILVIILILVVLVRVVQAPPGGRVTSTPL